MRSSVEDRRDLARPCEQALVVTDAGAELESERESVLRAPCRQRERGHARVGPDEVHDGIEIYVVERTPVDENSGYARQVVWIDKQEYRPQKVEYYDRKGTLLKTLTFHDYRQYLGKFWRAGRWEMVNHQTGKSTTLLWTNFSFKNGLSERDFNQNVLKSIYITNRPKARGHHCRATIGLLISKNES